MISPMVSTTIPSQLVKRYGQVVVLILVATLVGALIQPLVAPTNLVMLYLLAVVVAAVRLGYGPAVATATLSVLVFNFFFVPPELTLRVADAQYLLTFAALFVVGMVIANLTARLSEQATAAEQREAQTAALYALSKDLSVGIGLENIIQTALVHAQNTFQAEAAIVLHQDDHLALVAATPGYSTVQVESALIEQACHAAEPVIRAESSDQPTVLCLPLKTGQEIIGVLVLGLPGQIMIEEYRHLLSAFGHQVALAIEAVRLATKAQQAQLLHERDKLHTALLNSISHDLRTPLVSITGALSSLRDTATVYDEHARHDLLDGAWHEAQRLNRLVGNLLEMTRLESGMVRLNQEPFDVQELVGVTRSQLRDRFHDRQLIVDIPDDLPLLCIDLTLMIQVLVNLFDNALKYSPASCPVELRATCHGEHVSLEVADYGPGIPEEDLPHVFEKFYRSHHAQRVSGTGLGLSICEGIVEAHGGTISARNRPEGGAMFTITLPVAAG